ncbi:hypothetical protein [uncultured Fluviicola sp.]|uniref:hypothetical protein n=1 Tax=uncultured Fluviicola sp. TaxID=463303 RepID=UPI0025E0DEFF|nr:hypothetical protein [uncultured Fluviicola sp.]
MKEPNEIDLLFQNGLDGLAFTPDPYVKENIDHAIASKKKRRRFLFILFPVFFGLTGFAAIGLLYQNEGKNPQENKYQSQNEIRRSAVTTVLFGDSSGHLASNDPRPQTNIETKGRITKNNFQTSNSSGLVNSDSHQKSEPVFSPNEKLPSSGKQSSEAGFEVTKQELRIENTVVNPIDSIHANNRETLVITEKPDTSVVPLPDSASIAVSEALKHFGSNKGAGKWSLSVLTYWEAEKRKKNDFSDATFIGNEREIARVHASTFYAKAEITYKLNTNLEILSGLGFRTSKITQYGHLSTINVPLEGTTSGVPQPINPAEPDTSHRSEKQSFLVNSIVVPVGFAYTFPLTTKMSLRLSGGGEFAYGKITSRFIHPDLSAPGFNAFGCSLWLRPEIHYSFGRTQLFGFGTFNQSFSQQLQWNVDSRRNPAFGTGIGLRIRL